MSCHITLQEAKERVYQTGERVLHQGTELLHEAENKARQIPQEARSAWRDTLNLARHHPLWTAFLLTSLISIGMGLAASGFGLGLLTGHGRGSYSSGYSKISPQYKAHQALDTVLNSYYTSKQGASDMSDSAMNKLQSSYSTLGNILSSTKDTLMHPLGGTKKSRDDDEGLIGSMKDSILHPLGGKNKKSHDEDEHHFSILHPLGGGKKKSHDKDLDEDSEHGFLGNMAHKVKSWTGHSDLDDVEEAEEKLRKVLKSHKRMDD